MGRGFRRPARLKHLFAANLFVGCQFGRNRDRVTWVVPLALICAENKIADQNWPSERLMGKVFSPYCDIRSCTAAIPLSDISLTSAAWVCKSFATSGLLEV